MTSYNFNDVRFGYCGKCHAFTGTGPQFRARDRVGRDLNMGGYDVNGSPLEMLEWVYLTEEKYRTGQEWIEAGRPSDNRPWWCIGFDVIGDYHVSTVWLGTDYSWGRGAPLIFETMVFMDPALRGRSGESLDSLTDRYSTKEQAEAGHRRIVGVVQAQVDEQQRLDAELDHPAGKRRGEQP